MFGSIWLKLQTFTKNAVSGGLMVTFFLVNRGNSHEIFYIEINNMYRDAADR